MAKSSGEEYLRVDQVAGELGVSAKSVRGLINRGELPAYRFIKRRIVVAREDLEVFKESRRIVLADGTKEEVG